MAAQASVKVFFSKPSGGTPPPHNIFELTPVTRSANPTTPGRGALEALLGNVTSSEEAQGFQRLDAAGLSIGDLTIHNGTASVDFFSGGAKSWAGDLSPVTFKQAVEKTLQQFPTVQHVTVKVDGKADFDSLQ